MSLLLSDPPEELRAKFLNLKTRKDIASILEIGEDRLVYHLYIANPSIKYAAFQIPKKTGGFREILAPISALKIIQRKLAQVLQSVYQPKASVHGFVIGRHIVSNAKRHSGRRFVLNLDLENFFPSINFGRVRGLFIKTPYNLDPNVATVLAQICCFKNQLPQGAPTSPVVSNMICAKLDTQLRLLAEKHRCDYTRYADDITFSTNTREFPNALATTSSVTGQLEIGDELKRIIIQNGFKINAKKIRLQKKHSRQEVTGLTANRFPNVQRGYIRQIRAMLHAWEKFGLKNAEEEFKSKYDKKYRIPQKQTVSFAQVVKGKIEFLGMVRGKEDGIYIRFLSKLDKLSPGLGRSDLRAVPQKVTRVKPLIITEGKTDWKHLKAAFQALKSQGHFKDLEIEFNEYGEETKMGDAELLKMCSTFSKVLQNKPHIFIFDRDNRPIVDQVSDKGGTPKNWGNNVYSLAIPKSSFWPDVEDISIEFYYRESDLERKDKRGYRIFLSSEFDEKTGLNKLRGLYTDHHKIKSSKLTVIDSHVIDVNTNSSVALSKEDFAQSILTGDENFLGCDFGEFKNIFYMIAQILKDIDANAQAT